MVISNTAMRMRNRDVSSPRLCRVARKLDSVSLKNVFIKSQGADD